MDGLLGRWYTSCHLHTFSLRCAVDVSMHSTDGFLFVFWLFFLVVVSFSAVWFWVWPPFVLVPVCFSRLLCFRPFLQWIMHRTSFLTSRQFSHVKLPPRCQLPLHQLVQQVKSCITTRRKPLWRWSKKRASLCPRASGRPR